MGPQQINARKLVEKNTPASRKDMKKKGEGEKEDLFEIEMNPRPVGLQRNGGGGERYKNKDVDSIKKK